MELFPQSRPWQVLLLLLISWSPLINADCQIHVKNKTQMPRPEPLLLIPGCVKDIRGFKTPNTDGYITMKSDEQVTLACIGSKIFGVEQEVATLACDSGTTLKIGNRKYEFNTLRCEKTSQTAARETHRSCGKKDQYKEVELGFEVESDFYSLITACFDNSLKRTVYSKGTVLSTIFGAEDITFSIPWREDFFGFNANNQYNPDTQLATMTTLLGSEKQAQKYIDQKAQKFLTKGHLVPKGDMNLAVMADSTFFLVNAGPQWSKVNGLNWRKMEDSVKKYANEWGVDLETYTGTYGVTSLPHENGHMVPLYLRPQSNQMPIPKFFWKLVYNPRRRAAIVFVTLNNPFYKPPPEYFICAPEVCNKITWIKWSPNNRNQGYSYCCEYEEFKAVVTDVPVLDVTSVLD